MPLTSNGLEAKRFNDILSSINQDLSVSLGVDLNTSPDTVLGILTNIFSGAVAQQELLSQAVADNFNIDKAEGIFLDNLVALNNLKRLNESVTQGNIFITASVDGLSIPSGTLFTDNQSNNYTTNTSKVISSSANTGLIFTPSTNVGTFEVTINNSTFSKTYTEVQPETTIAADLEFEINQSSPTEYTVSREGSEVTIAAVNKFKDLLITRNENISFTQVESRVEVSALEVGNINPPIGTVTNILNNSANVLSVTNYDTFSVGRLKETDDELRFRQKLSPQTSRRSTTGAIFTALNNLEGVSLVRIFENRSQITDGDGRPPHSYECIIEGGEDQSIAEVIWDSKPAGAETYGNITSVVSDYADNPEVVQWSRPELKYINVKVTYSPYSEETIPDNVVDTIKTALVEYGDNLGLDVDIIPQRMYGVIYGAVEGVGSMTIEVGTSLDPSSSTPDDIAYTTNNIPISKRQKADFNTARIQVVEV